MKEKWRNVVGYEGFYSVSNHGRVRSEKRTILRSNGVALPVRERIMVLSCGKDNPYLNLKLAKCGDHVTRSVADLVLMAFIGPRPMGLESCHNDGNEKNNHASNLRWDTRGANARDRIRHGTSPVGERNPCAVLTEETVRALRLRRLDGVFYKQLGAEFGISPMTAQRAVVGTSWRHVR